MVTSVNKPTNKSVNALAPLFVGAVILTIGAGIFTYSGSGAASVLGTQQARIAELQNQISDAKSSYAKLVSDQVANSTGLESDRVSRDNGAVEPVLKQIFTWDSLDTYNNARSVAKEKFGLSDDNVFLVKAMPTVKVETDKDGKSTNAIEKKHLNMTYKNMSSTVSDISGAKYTYRTIVTVEGANSAGSTATSRVLVTYKTDNNGTFSDFSMQRLS